MSDRAKAVTSTTHPMSGQQMSGADIVVQTIADEGIDTIFGYSGGAILPTYDAVFRYNDSHKRADGSSAIPLVVPANEQGAGFMAAGYARASGKVGVVMVTSGPGATNCVTPVRDCMADSVPIVVICGQVPTAAIGTDAFQEAPVSAIMGAVAKHVFLVTDPTRLEATMRSAFELAQQRPTRPCRRRYSQGRAELGRQVPGRRHLVIAWLSPQVAARLSITSCRTTTARASTTCSCRLSGPSFTPVAASSMRMRRNQCVASPMNLASR